MHIDDSLNEELLISGVGTSRDSNEGEYNVSASLVPYLEHYVTRSIPLCGVHAILPGTNDLTRQPAVGDRQEKDKKQNGTLVVYLT